jgi:hypothetical protein
MATNNHYQPSEITLDRGVPRPAHNDLSFRDMPSNNRSLEKSSVDLRTSNSAEKKQKTTKKLERDREENEVLAVREAFLLSHASTWQQPCPLILLLWLTLGLAILAGER